MSKHTLGDVVHDLGQILNTLVDHPDRTRGNTRVHYAYEKTRSALTGLVESADFSISGPTDTRAAENNEPAWVCKARALIAKATAP